MSYLAHKEEALICAEIEDWSHKVLEVSSKEFNGLPPCPYAKQAWARNKVRQSVIKDLDECIEIKKNCPDDDSVDVVAWTGFNQVTTEEFDEWLDKQNDESSGIWTIGFHPDHPVDESIGEFEGNGSPEYGLILIQSHRHLAKSSQAIFKRGYYNNYSNQDIKHIKQRNKK
jgi:hypothetical protein